MRSNAPLIIKYRPHSWDTVVGQDRAVSQLKGILSTHTIPNALLFSGPSGVGKTSLARLFTQYLNCTTNDLCGKCPSCKTSLVNNPNFVEMNAADARGIDDVRDLISKLKYRPSISGTFRVFLVDEAHAWTGPSWQAFLKPLEEMPSSSFVIFSSTNPEKFPPAIRGRCLQIPLNHVSEPELVKNLKRVIKEEKWAEFKKQDELLVRIANAAGGQVRDSLQFLESIHYSALATDNLDTAATKVLGSLQEETKNVALLLMAIIADDAEQIFVRSKFVSNWVDAINKMSWGLVYIMEKLSKTGNMYATPFNTLIWSVFTKLQKQGVEFGYGQLFSAGRLLSQARQGIIQGTFDSTSTPYFLVKESHD